MSCAGDERRQRERIYYCSTYVSCLLHFINTGKTVSLLVEAGDLAWSRAS
jgi:hypothetical protein